MKIIATESGYHEALAACGYSPASEVVKFVKEFEENATSSEASKFVKEFEENATCMVKAENLIEQWTAQQADQECKAALKSLVDAEVKRQIAESVSKEGASEKEEDKKDPIE